MAFISSGYNPAKPMEGRITDIGPHKYDEYFPPVIKKNFGKWLYHEILEPGVLMHVAEGGDKVYTVRALKMHGGGPEVVPGRPLPEAYTREDLALLEAGCANLLHHAATIRKSGVTPVVCINKFYTDTDAELELVRRICAENGLRCAVSDHWRYGGAGAEELARAVMEACDEPSTLKFLYPDDMPLRERVERIAREVYGAEGVDWSPLALEKAQRFESDPRYADYCTMMVKTHLSLSHDPARKGVPTGWRLPVRDVLEYSGARFLCPVAGSISMMPGTGSDPAYRRIDVDTATGAVRGLF